MRPLLLLAALSLGGCTSLTAPAGIATGMTANQVCNAVFVSGLEPDAYYREALAPLMKPAPGLTYRVDRERKEVTATVAGVFTSRAVYRGPAGCLVVHGAAPPPAQLDPPRPQDSLLAPIAGPQVVEPSDPALKTALDHAFADYPKGAKPFTKAVVIVHDGKVIAERYAPGYGVDTPIAGWSMSKSVNNALAGILAGRGWLDMDAPAPIAAWADPKDPRHAITPDNLLRMTSGLKLGNSLSADSGRAFDRSARMMFVERDMAAFAATARPGAAPGTTWTYSDASAVMFSRVLKNSLAAHGQGSEAAFWRFSHRELFDKLGMEHVTFPVDAEGTPIGSSHILASARDWARFGMLYLNDGVVGGERILPEGWVDYSARMTPAGNYIGYGAGFWTNRGDSYGARKRMGDGMPADAFMARGAFGQFTIVVPSAKLVIVRLGYSMDPWTDMTVMGRMTGEVVAATKGR